MVVHGHCPLLRFGAKYSSGIDFVIVDPLVVVVNGDDDVFCSIASEEDGVLPHDIANNSIIFIDKKAKYKKEDYIVIKDSRVVENGFRITRALSEKDKDFVGRLVMSIKIY